MLIKTGIVWFTRLGMNCIHALLPPSVKEDNLVIQVSSCLDFDSLICFLIQAKRYLHILTNKVDPDQTAPKEQSDQGLLCMF